VVYVAPGSFLSDDVDVGSSVGQEEGSQVQGFPPPRPRPLSPSPLVPMQQTRRGGEAPRATGSLAEGALAEGTQAGQRHALPAPRQDPIAPTRAGIPLARARVSQPDAIVFTAPCPACGADCDWTEQREDTRLRAVVSCPCT
jgi:hypothetical protein